MSEETRPPGKTTIAPDVLLSIARLTTLGVDGVSRLSGLTSVNDIFQRGQRSGGVRIHIKDNYVNIDLHVILEQDVNIRQISRSIQEEVTRAITEMVGMDIGQVNVHIEDINYEREK
ncbi:Asp23/Gls24 family envelope stress response protein [Chloroflexota bacterium]